MIRPSRTPHFTHARMRLAASLGTLAATLDPSYRGSSSSSAASIEMFDTCPVCGSVALLELEYESAKYVAPLNVCADGAVVCAFFDDEETCVWVNSPSIDSEIVGCAACGARFADSETQAVERDSAAAHDELWRIAEDARRHEPGTPWGPIDRNGRTVPPFDEASPARLITCAGCGSSRWAVNAVDQTVYACLRAKGEYVDHDIIRNGIVSWNVGCCTDCGRELPRPLI